MSLVDVLIKVAELYLALQKRSQADADAFAGDVGRAVDKIKSAKTEEEKRAALSSVIKVTNSL